MKNSHRLLTITFACLMTAVIPNADAVSTAKLSSFGTPSGDDTNTIQAAMAAQVGGILVVDKLDKAWVAQPLTIPSNIEIQFEAGAEIQAKKGAFLGTNDILININNAENITIRGPVNGGKDIDVKKEDTAVGNRGILRMWPADYDDTTKYEHAEWRHSICIKSSKNIQIHDMKLDGSGGDGIYLGVSTTGVFPTDIVVKNVECVNHYRQGLSVIAGVNCLFENVLFKYTRGTAPMAGVDFEPNKASEAIYNFVLKDCHSYGNAGWGYAFYLLNQTEEAGPMGILLDNCTSEADGLHVYYQEDKSTIRKYYDTKGTEYRVDAGGTISIQYPNGINSKGESLNRPGYITFKGGTYTGRSGSSAVVALYCTNADGFATIFDGVTFKNIAMGSSKKSPIQIAYCTNSYGTAGNLHFINDTKVIDSKKRTPIAFTNGSLEGGLENITGVIKCYSDDSTPVQDFEVSQLAVARQKVTDRLYLLDIDDMEFEAVTPNASVTDTFSAIKQRDKGSWLILGSKGKTLKFSAMQDCFSDAEGKTQAPATVTLTTPSGTTTTFSEKLPFSGTAVSYTKTLTEDGLYTMTITCTDQCAHVVTCNLPILIHTDSPSLCGRAGDADYITYFYVPEKTETFGIDFTCDAEGLGATLYAPSEDGSSSYVQDPLFQDLDMHEVNRYIWKKGDTAATSGIFKLVLKQPTSGSFEDYNVTILNIPPLLGLHPSLLIKEK